MYFCNKTVEKEYYKPERAIFVVTALFLVGTELIFSNFASNKSSANALNTAKNPIAEPNEHVDELLPNKQISFSSSLGFIQAPREIAHHCAKPVTWNLTRRWQEFRRNLTYMNFFFWFFFRQQALPKQANEKGQSVSWRKLQPEIVHQLNQLHMLECYPLNNAAEKEKPRCQLINRSHLSPRLLTFYSRRLQKIYANFLETICIMLSGFETTPIMRALLRLVESRIDEIREWIKLPYAHHSLNQNAKCFGIINVILC